ncbi:hypothetical protein Bca52824_088158 [Brassica carinata]|uniref:Uncharacterized protein n=1 Tax=Brassica carinata TaxID=52824 RepID=A0A8X7PC08_BRACI|nr:hypothetical protein Bca52824_088158 [Brassica carinata]
MMPNQVQKKCLRGCWEKAQKEGVSLGIVNFGEENNEEKPQKLEPLLSAVNSNNGSHIVHVPSEANDFSMSFSDILNGTGQPLDLG